MLKCNELDLQAPDGEAKPFWRGGEPSQAPCALGCGAQPAATAQAAAPAVPAIPTSMQNELVAAQEICSRAKTAVVEMFGHARMGRALELEHISA